MFGTIARMRVKAGHESEVERFEGQAEAVREAGLVATTVYRSSTDPREYWLAVVFRDEQSYRANASSPEQDQRFRELMGHLEAEPEWHDGQVVYSYPAGAGG
jgi:heme-degrading monooxygenase HmoA